MPGIRYVLRRSLLVFATGLLALSAAMITATASPASAAPTCSAGYYSNGSSCVAATPGSYAPGDNNEYPCPAGTYQPYSGQAGCFTAGSGYYASSGSSSETACLAGSYQPSMGAAGCLSAGPGYYVVAIGSASEAACPAGFYQPDSGQVLCQEAGPGYFVASSGSSSETACLPGTYQPDSGQTSPASCLSADPGYYVASAGSATETACLPGTYQPGPGSVSCLSADPGYYVASAGSASETACPAGTYQPSSGQTSCNLMGEAVLTDSSGNPIAGAAVTFRSASGSVASATTGPDGTASAALTPGTYAVTMYYANGYQTQTLTVTANGSSVASFATVAVTAQISDPSSADLATASVAHAGNTGTYGPKTPVDPNSGQVTFQVLPGTSTFTAYEAGGYQTQTLSVTGTATVTFTTVPVTVQISDPSSADLATASVAHAGNTGTYGPKTPVDPNSGQVTFQVLPGTSTFAAYDAGGYQTQTLSVTGPATVTFATVAVTVTVDKNGSPLTSASVAHAGNTGTYGPKTPVDPGSGQVTFQVLPGTSTFAAYDGTAYTKQTLTITTATSTTISVA